MKNEDTRQRFDAMLEAAGAGPSHTVDQPYIRISNERYAADSSLEDRLSFEDRQMLSKMGIRF